MEMIVRIMEMGLTLAYLRSYSEGSYGVSMEIKIRGYLLSLEKRNHAVEVVPV